MIILDNYIIKISLRAVLPDGRKEAQFDRLENCSRRLEINDLLNNIMK